MMPYAGPNITLIWLPTGIATTALLRWGWAVLPGVFLGAFLVNLSIGSTWPLAASIAVGNTLGPLLASRLLKRFQFHPEFDRQRDVGWFIVAASVGMTVSATWGISSLYLAGMVSPETTNSSWRSWWMGDTVGVLLVAPLLLTITRKNFLLLYRERKDFLLWLLVASSVAWLAFIHDFSQDRSLPFAFLTLPLSAWAALRFGITGGSLAALGFSVVAAWSTAMGHGALYMSSIHLSQLLLWGYMATTVVTGLLITVLHAKRQEVESTLRRQKDFSEDIIGSLPGVFYIVNQQGKFIQVNSRFLEVLGYSKSELDHMTALDCFETKDRSLIAQRIQEVFEKGESWADAEFLTKSGQKILYHFTGRRTSINSQLYLVGLGTDITERRKQEEQTRQLLTENETILSNAVVGIVYLKHRRVVSCNRRFEEMFQYEPGELIGKSSELFYDSHETFEHIGVVAYKAATESKGYIGDVKLRHKDGSVFWGTLSGKSLDPAHPHEGSIWIYSDISERKLAEEALRIAATAFDSQESLMITDANGVILRVNQAFIASTGYTAEDAVGQTPRILKSGRHDAAFYRVLWEIVHRTGTWQGEIWDKHKNGEIHPKLLTISAVKGDDGVVTHYVGSHIDITEHRRAEDALIESQARLDLALRSADMGVWSFDIVANKRHFDDQTCRLMGIDPATFTGAEKEFFRTIHPDDREMLKVKMSQAFEQNVPYEPEYRAVWPDGSIHHIAGRGRVVRDDQNMPIRVNGIVFDITEWKEAQNKIHSLAFYDPLTGLPNRRLLTDRLQQALVSSARNGLVGAILFIDLDNFKTINDTLGHALGDALLQQAATRLTSCVREEDTVARIGGDEFVVMLEYLVVDESVAATQTESICEKILAALSQPFQIASNEYRSTCSIGVTLFNDSQQSTDELLKQADIAMYQAKKAGRNTLRFFDTHMQEIVTTRVAMEGKLRKALEHQQFQLYYQIQVNSFLQPIGAEALIRWSHPDRGLVVPAQFIPLAEETGLIVPIGQWVMETACAQLKAWEREEHTSALVLAVNVSAREFRQADFVAQVQDSVLRHAIDPKRLKLELTESLLLENIEDTIAIMNALNEIGVQFSLDDFGTGYSSLQYLKRLPLHQIKIDQSFVRDLVADSGDIAIVRTIIAMAKSLNLEVIAEGVETEEHLQILLNTGCTHYQGYLFGKPVPIEQFETLLKNG